MARFYIPPHAWNPDKLALDDAEARHAVQVLRMKVGDRATVFNGQGCGGDGGVCESGKGAGDAAQNPGEQNAAAGV